MEEFDWSSPEIEREKVEKWIEIEDPELTFDDNELNEDQVSDIILQEYEFDVQPRLLRKKEKKQIEFYVEYDKLTNDIIEITPQHKQPSTLKHGVFTTKQSDLINKIFDGKLPLSKIHIKHKNRTEKELTVGHGFNGRSEFDYIFANYNSDRAPLHIYCDIVMKKISVNLDYQKMKQYLSLDNLSETILERNNGHFNIYAIDTLDRTKLYDKIPINIFELCNIQTIDRKCKWLPDSNESFKNMGFLYHNNDLPITFSLQTVQEDNRIYDNFERPQIIYKQVGNKILLQSIMGSTNNFKINEDIMIFIFSKFDPTRLIEYKKINRSTLDNFNLYEIELSYYDPVSVTTDHFHIHLEDSNVSTYYRI